MPVQNVKKFKLLVVLLNILNIADGLLTHYWLSTGKCYEFNPFMALFSNDPICFWVVKLTLVGIGSAFLYKYVESFMSRVSIIVLNIVYCSIIFYHAWYII